MKLFLCVGMTVFIAFFVCMTPFCTYYENIAHKITEKTAKKLQEEKDLRLIGTGGRMMDDIKQMNMSFYFYHEAELEVVRSLMVYVIDEYLSEINNSKEIRPYLHEVPFTAKNLEIDIFFTTQIDLNFLRKKFIASHQLMEYLNIMYDSTLTTRSIKKLTMKRDLYSQKKEMVV